MENYFTGGLPSTILGALARLPPLNRARSQCGPECTPQQGRIKGDNCTGLGSRQRMPILRPARRRKISG